MKILKYNQSDPISIYEYSHNIIGHSLCDLYGKEAIEGVRKGKGRLGQMVEELFFEYEVNSDCDADFKEAGVELKCTPLLKYIKDNTWRIKERLVCTMIDYFKTDNETFEDSHFLRKCRLMLLLFYSHVYGEQIYNYEFIFRVLWKIPEKDLLIIKQDYETIVNKIKQGKAHLLSEGDTVYLAACRKGQKGDKMQVQPYSNELARKRAFSLKPAYMRTILEQVVNSGKDYLCNFEDKTMHRHELVSLKELKEKSFEDIILKRFQPYIGSNYVEICNMLDIPQSTAKHKYAMAANEIATNKSTNIEESEEFQKSGIRMKTIRIATNGTPEEAMSFKNINYKEVYDNGTWIDSELYELFTSRFLFVVFKNKKDKTISISSRKGIAKIEDEYVLHKVFFWTMPEEDLNTACQYWINIRRNVIKNQIRLNYFWSIADKKKFHVRPKGTKTSYQNAAENPNGGKVDKYCYWFNPDYVKNITETETTNEKGEKMHQYNQEEKANNLCEPIAEYSRRAATQFKQLNLFSPTVIQTEQSDIRVIELFAGVGGFRIGLERASQRYKTVWNNQWEPSTKRQDASIVYCKQFGTSGHSNQDIATVAIDDIPDGDLLVGGFPCQDYSVATTLKNSGGIEGKKGVLWWQIYRIIKEHKAPPSYLFLENVDRLLNSPASQRGRDFAIILASLADMGYIVEWRIINAADYGMPQRRKRTYILAYKKKSAIAEKISEPWAWIKSKGTIASAFPIIKEYTKLSEFKITGNLTDISNDFNKGQSLSPFKNTGIMINRQIFTFESKPNYDGISLTLGEILENEENVSEDFYISEQDLERWKYLKGNKTEKRINKASGFEYNYSEGKMAFPDYLERPSRTIITGEGGSGASRFKHIVLTPSGRYRRLTPVELERLNMFPDNHTIGASDTRRAFLMGNALVTGIIEKIGLSLLAQLK